MIVFTVIGFILAAIGGLWILALAFQESVLWGIGCIVVPFVSLLFIVSHFDETAKPLGIQLLGLAIMFVPPLVIG